MHKPAIMDEIIKRLDKIQNTLDSLLSIKENKNSEIVKEVQETMFYVVFMKVNKICNTCHGGKVIMGVYSSRDEANKDIVKACEFLNNPLFSKEKCTIDDFILEPMIFPKDQKIVYEKVYASECDHVTHTGIYASEKSAMFKKSCMEEIRQVKIGSTFQ